MAVNKVVYGSKVIIDISDSTVTPETLAEGVVAYNAKGERIVGTLDIRTALSQFTHSELTNYKHEE